MKKTAMILAEGFEEVEALTAVDLLRRAGIVCDMVALAEEELVTGSHGIGVRADRSYTGTDFSEYDGIILPGGLKGTEKLAADERLLALLRRFAAEGKLTAAICAAPMVLAKAGLLEGRKAICYPGMEEKLTGAELCYEPAVRDGTVITGRGMGASVPFGLELVSYFEGPERAQALAEKVVWQGSGK